MNIDARENELLSSLYLGELPEWVTADETPYLRLTSDRRRLNVSKELHRLFPRGAFYANARLGDGEVLRGVCEAFVELPGTSGDLLGRVEAAARVWLDRTRPDDAVRSLFDYDAFTRAPHEVGGLADALRASGLADVLAVRTFTASVRDFARMIDFLRRHSAPAEITRRYAPHGAPQTLALTERDGQRLVVDVTALAGRLR